MLSRGVFLASQSAVIELSDVDPQLALTRARQLADQATVALRSDLTALAPAGVIGLASFAALSLVHLLTRRRRRLRWLSPLRWPLSITAAALWALGGAELAQPTRAIVCMLAGVSWLQLVVRGIARGSRALIGRVTAPWRGDELGDNEEPQARFRRRLGEEIARAKRRPDGVFCLLAACRTNGRGVGPRAAARSRQALLSQLGEAFRCYDTHTVDGDGVLYLLLPETRPEDCRRVVPRIRQAFALADPGRIADQALSLGIVGWTDGDDTTVDELVASVKRGLTPLVDERIAPLCEQLVAEGQWFVEERCEPGC